MATLSHCTMNLFKKLISFQMHIKRHIRESLSKMMIFPCKLGTGHILSARVGRREYGWAIIH